jgi:hypothetical protein
MYIIISLELRERERDHVPWPERAYREVCIFREAVQLTPKAEVALEIARNFSK